LLTTTAPAKFKLFGEYSEEVKKMAFF